MDKKNISPIDGEQLLLAIANKDKDRDAAEKALTLFIGHFESKIMLPVEKLAKNIGYDENVAFSAIQCAFAKVWYYPTFDMNKARCKDPEKAIELWLIQIAVSQMHQFSSKGECTQIKDDEDLSVIEDSESFVNAFNAIYLDTEQRLAYITALNQKISKLDEKHRIVYLTYKAYHTRGKKLPRTVLKKLRERLGIVQTTVRVYKKEACEILNDNTLLEL